MKLGAGSFCRAVVRFREGTIDFNVCFCIKECFFVLFFNLFIRSKLTVIDSCEDRNN